MAASEEYDHTTSTEQDGLNARQAVQKSNLDASSDAALNSSGVSTNICVDAEPKKKSGTKKKKRNRCEHAGCKKKLKKSRTFLSCRCGGLFCPDHRLQCDHECTYEKPQASNTKSVKFDSLQERM